MITILSPSLQTKAKVQVELECKLGTAMPESPNPATCKLYLMSSTGEDSVSSITGNFNASNIKDMALFKDWEATSNSDGSITFYHTNNEFIRLDRKILISEIIFGELLKPEFIIIAENSRNELEYERKVFDDFQSFISNENSPEVTQIKALFGLMGIDVKGFHRENDLLKFQVSVPIDGKTKEYETIFQYDHGNLILRTNNKDELQVFCDMLSTMIVFYSTAGFHGYNTENFHNWMNSLSEQELLSTTLEKDGYVFQFTPSGENNENVQINYFAVDLKNGIKSYDNNKVYDKKGDSGIFPDLENKDENDENQNIENSENGSNVTSKEEIENPQTGSFVPYAVIGIGIIMASLAFKISRKNTKLYKI